MANKAERGASEVGISSTTKENRWGIFDPEPDLKLKLRPSVPNFFSLGQNFFPKGTSTFSSLGLEISTTEKLGLELEAASGSTFLWPVGRSSHSLFRLPSGPLSLRSVGPFGRRKSSLSLRSMDLSFPDTPDIQLIVKVTSNPKSVGLWTSQTGPTQGHKILRVENFDQLWKGFFNRIENLRVLDIHRTSLVRLPDLWSLFEVPKGSLFGCPRGGPDPPSGRNFFTQDGFRLRVFCPSRSLKDMLPPWLRGISPPDEEKVYPPGVNTYPPKEQVFSGLWFDPSKLKVLIIGQDPYPTEGHAHGLAFSYRGEGTTPASLRNIFAELSRTVPGFEGKSRDLTLWFRQGVAMINTSLSVLEGQPDSLAKEWEVFSKKLFLRLGQKTGKGLVILAWGGKAKPRAASFVRAKLLTSSHPSPLGVNSPPTPFKNNNHFILANNHLISTGQTPIDWRL